MPPKFPWFPCWVADWLGSSRIAAMTAAQEGAYHRLLCLAWSDKECTLPNDPEMLSNMSKLPADQLEPVLACFEPHPTLKKRIYNVRLTEEWKKAEQFHIVRSHSGAIGALKRWHGDAIAQPKRGNSILQSQSHLQEEKKLRVRVKPVDKNNDRTTHGFQQAGDGLTEAIQKLSEASEADQTEIVQPDLG